MTRANALTSKLGWLTPALTWNRLHYIEGVDQEAWIHWWDNGDTRCTAVCGCSFEATLPGLLSRLGAPRCKHCCRTLGIPDGFGAPSNDASLTLSDPVNT